MTTDRSNGDSSQRKRVTIQITSKAADRLDEVAVSTGLTRPRIVEHLVLRQSTRDLLRLLKNERPEPTRFGRPKESVFRTTPARK